MAACPKCKGLVGTTAVTCPHCGYDWPDDDLGYHPPSGWEESNFAELALCVAAIMAAIGCFGVLLAGPGLASRGEWWSALFWCPLAFFYQFALLIVFLRVRNRKR
jgi:hypothetical protein